MPPDQDWFGQFLRYIVLVFATERLSTPLTNRSFAFVGANLTSRSRPYNSVRLHMPHFSLLPQHPAAVTVKEYPLVPTSSEKLLSRQALSSRVYSR